MKITSVLLDEAVQALSTLPGIGKKTALRLALFLQNQPEDQVISFCNAISDMRIKLQSCIQCGNISDEKICGICADQRRECR